MQCVQSVGLHGGVMDPHACFLLQRGLATLGLRVRQQNATGLAAAHYLAQHPKVRQPPRRCVLIALFLS